MKPYATGPARKPSQREVRRGQVMRQLGELADVLNLNDDKRRRTRLCVDAISSALSADQLQALVFTLFDLTEGAKAVRMEVPR